MIDDRKDWLFRLTSLSWPMAFLMAFAWLAISAGVRPLMLPDEGRYVGVAWEMLTSGHLGVPLLDGLPFFHKPPLFYWLTAIGLEVFGPNVWSARLASVIGGSCAAAGLYWFVRRHVDGRTAALASLVLLTQPFFFVGAQFANLDILVAGMIAVCIVAAASAVLRAEAGQPYRQILVTAYVFAALGLLTKGLIGFVLPGGVLVLWLLASRRWKGFLTLLWWPAIVLFLLLGLPWFVLMQQRYSGFFDYFVIYHHFKRFAEGGFNNQQPIWFYVPVLLLLTLPWSPWLWQSFGGKGRAAAAQSDKSSASSPSASPDVVGARRDIGLLMWCWLGVIVLFFSLPHSKLVGYVLPTLPPLAYLIAAPFGRRLATDRAPRALRQFGLTLVFGAAVCLFAIFAVATRDLGSAKPMAVEMRKQLASTDTVVMLGEYQYDLVFYLRWSKPAWVVSAWDDPSIPQHDNWRKELYDASLFDREASHQTLLTPAQFDTRLCQLDPAASLWVWGDEADQKHFAVLSALPAYASEKNRRVWRVTPSVRRSFCETPNSGSAQK